MADTKLSALKTRIKTACVLALILALVIYIGETAIFYFICLVSILAQWEFLTLFFKHEKTRYKIFYCFLGIFYILSIYYYPEIPPIFYIGLVGLISTFISLKNFNHDTAQENMKTASILMLSFIYLPFIFGFMTNFTLSQQLLVALIPIASDTVAYFVGINYGKHKIWPTVSPKKSVEGCAAGLIAAIIVLLIFAYQYHIIYASFFTLVFFGAILGILAQLGDFFESALKRTVDIKDSGFILPGHGGVLDRTDSLIFTIAGFELFTLLLNAL